MVYIPPMRILLVGDTPFTRRLVHIFDAYWTNDHGLLVPEADLQVFNEFRPNVVINGQFVETDEPTAFRSNGRDPAISALYARMVGSNYVHMSDTSVFSSDMPRATDDPYPTRIYGLSRLLGERAVRSLHPNASIVRTSWMYGPDVPESPPMVAADAASGDRAKAHVYNDVKVTPTYIGDAAGVLAANVVSMHVGALEWGYTHHMAPELSCTWFDLLKGEFDILPVKSRFTAMSGRKVHRNVSVQPSAGFVISPGGLERFRRELDTGEWDWTAGFNHHGDTSESA